MSWNVQQSIFYLYLGVRTFFERVWRRMFERCYIVTRMCASPRNLTWFIRRFSSWEDIVSGDVISLHYHSQWTNSITAMIDVHLYTVCVFIYYFTHTWVNFLYVWLNRHLTERTFVVVQEIVPTTSFEYHCMITSVVHVSLIAKYNC